MNNEQLTMNN